MNRNTKIIATIGPSSSSRDVIASLIEAGMDMARLNFSWGTHEEMADHINLIREAAKAKGKTVPVIQDLSGPRTLLEHGHGLNVSADKVITDKDRADLGFGLDHAVEYVALSYVATAEDVRDLRELMVERGSVTPIIAKIERREAVDNIASISDAADGIMIARGDLGKAFPLEELPSLERMIVGICKEKRKFVIVATEMLLSMTEVEAPTRAEVIDVAYAVELGADAVMLSEETASGKHPVESVKEMDRIARFAEEEKHYPHHSSLTS